MHTLATPLLWSCFGVFVVVALVVDFIGLRRQGAHRVELREALVWSAAWVGVSLAFAAVLWWWLDAHAGRAVATARTLEFLGGYVVEKSLAVDNVFLFLTVFGYFALPAELQKRALVVGIVAAIVLRTAMILGGALLIARFAWVLDVFGVVLVVTAWKLWRSAGRAPSRDGHPVVRLLERFVPVSSDYDGERLFTRRDGVRRATPMLLVVVAIGLIDVIFAVDSIPAVFAITTDPFVVLTSNVFAVLGLRAMFFLVAGLADRFHLLPYGLAIVLAFVGAKMLAADVVHVSPLVSLAVIVTILGATMVASARAARQSPDPSASRPVATRTP